MKDCNFICIMEMNKIYYNDVLNVIALRFLSEEMNTKLVGELNSSSDLRDLLLCKLRKKRKGKKKKRKKDQLKE